MAVNIIDINTIEWRSPGKDWKAGQDETTSEFKPFDTASGVVPGGQLVVFPPGHHQAAHSHEESEFLYFLEGECTVGGELITAGVLVHIDGKTVYGPLEAGPEGAKFLRLHLTA